MNLIDTLMPTSKNKIKDILARAVISRSDTMAGVWVRTQAPRTASQLEAEATKRRMAMLKRLRDWRGDQEFTFAEARRQLSDIHTKTVVRDVRWLEEKGLVSRYKMDGLFYYCCWVKP